MQIFFLGLPNLGTQIRCPQNWYTVVQTDLKYPLLMQSLTTILWLLMINPLLRSSFLSCVFAEALLYILPITLKIEFTKKVYRTVLI